MTRSGPDHESRFIHAVLRPVWLRVRLAAILKAFGRVTGAPVSVPVVPWEVNGDVVSPLELRHF